ncbi:minor tail protein [Gordonia phage Ruthy]|uniref:Minor tail protein n=1 Tax=Gordonia phage Ruthy TaxID=2250323 RepID=A0A345L5D3_9CAUD|nr:minor tail protein [Gordonia phage Ruthy]AXH50485.1 minor tail protein [Gordonia phage Ruthy]
MPRVVDLNPRSRADKDPLQGLLDFTDLDKTIETSGDRVTDALKHIRATFVQWLKDTVGIDLTGVDEFAEWLDTHLGLPSLDQLLSALRGEYDGENLILNAIQALFAPVRRVLQIFTGRPGGLNAAPAEVDSFWDDMQKTLKGENTAGEWFEDVSIAVASGVADLAQNIQNAVQGGMAVGSGVIAGAHNAVSNLFGLADAAQKIAMAAQQQIQDLQNETNQPGFEGFAWSTIFAGVDGAALPSGDFVGSGLSIRGSDGHVGITDGAADGHHYKITTHEFLSDTQSASIVLGNRFSSGDDMWTSVLVRCNADGTEGVFARSRRGTVQLGRFTRSGTTFTWSSWYSVSRTQNQGDILRIKTAGDNYYVQVNGSTVIPWTDTSGTVSKGAAFRHAGFTEQKDTLFGLPLVSFRIASFAMADWSPPGGAVTTPAWHLRRGTTGFASLAVSSGSAAAVPSGFFTIADLAAAVTVANLGLGQVTVTEAGFYRMRLTAQAVVDVANGSPSVPCVWGVYLDNYLATGAVMGEAIEVYIAAGQVVSPRIFASWPATQSTSSQQSTALTLTNTKALLAQTSDIKSIGGPAAAWTGRKVA